MEEMYITIGVAFLIGGGIGYLIGVLDGSNFTKKIYQKAMDDTRPRR